MLSAFHHTLHRRPGLVHVTTGHWLLTASSVFFTVLTIVVLFLVVFATRAALGRRYPPYRTGWASFISRACACAASSCTRGPVPMPGQ